MKKKILLPGLAMLCIVASIRAQDVLYSPTVLPKSPESYAFGKNISIPVSYSSGTPQISIPFYTAQSGSIAVPVSISYNASGIRVEEVPTWVGLGWSLSAGGQISRVVRGDPDDRQFYGYMTLPANRKVKYVDTAHCRCMAGTGQTWQIEQELNTNHQLDLEPDMYSFSVLGYSGDFFWSQDSGKFTMVPYQNISITGSPGSPGSFTFVLPNGVKAVFGGGSTYVEKLLSGTNTSYVDGNSQAPVSIENSPYETGWALKEIEDPTGKKITFNYIMEADITFGRATEKFGPSLSSTLLAMRNQSFYRQYIFKPLITSISAEFCNIYFNRSTAHRQDMPDYSDGARSLDTILITNKSGTPIKSFYFDYGYFVSPTFSTTGILDVAGFAEEARRRLYLKAIRERNGNDSIPPYEFTYSDIELPSRFSNSQDYWGYYNGKTNGAYMIPRLPNQPFNPILPFYAEDNHLLPGYGQYLNSGGADRRIDTSYSEARILKKVKYPTGGSSEYYYEQNEANHFYLNIYGGLEPPDMVEKAFTLSLLSNPWGPDPPYPLYFSGNFTIHEPSTQLKITPTFPSPCSINVDPSCKYMAKIKSLPDSTLISTINTTAPIQIQLPSGTYLVEVFVNDNPNNFPSSFSVLCQWGERLDTLSFKVGGVRIKKIINRDSVGNNISRSYRYKWGTNGSQSTGIIEGCPTYKVLEHNTAGYRRYYTSNSVVPLTSEGKTVRYEFVTEFYDSAFSSYKTEYTFTSGISNPQKFATGYSGAPLTTWNWQHNLLKRQQHFEKTATGTYRPLTDEQNYFTAKNPSFDLYGLFGPQIIQYNIVTEWYLPDSTSTTSYTYYGNQQDSLKSYSKTFYNDRFLPSVSRSANSKDQLIDSKTWYPSDYNDVSGYNIGTLLNKHIISIPVKQEVSASGKVRSGNIIKYNEVGQPTDGYSYENATLSDTVVHDKNTVLESNYQLKTSLKYDPNFNIRQVVNFKGGSSNSAYIWTSEPDAITGLPVNTYPVAGVVNADTTRIAYCSFETTGTGFWTYSGTITPDVTSPMGVKCLSFNGANISRTGLNSGTRYIVSYWTKSGSYSVSGSTSTTQGKTLNGWTYYEHEVTGITTLTITASTTSYIDELRLYPKGAFMTSYNYKPVIGVNAICDNNSRITYYEYDDLGRLTYVRDEDKYIVKKVCYSFSGQPTSCGFGTAANWQAIGKTCQQSGGFNTGYMTVNEKDMNPLSATYGQTRTSTVISNGCPVCGTCTGVDKKCIDNVCSTAVKVYTVATFFKGKWQCTYHYVWAADCSTSTDFNEQLTSQPTLGGGPCQ